ncbi:hypothetical protein VIGAN_11087800 [Vigna angularis var. angularis]|uniref:Uncharacterized protein n=1 Tax=Vigna angularis var. angularis TaxID=157739 RepID=A0A0S3T8U0_PHAAN|nr:uncharacterized protein LOC108345222 [Vigna angularis]BAU01609.1 hypothetical protein VIGAN_11087800 [Vigna angularis var. angularis]
MDLFAADHFPVPDHVAPFPDSGDLLFPADLLSHRHNPQKLRPIRSLPSALNAHPRPPDLIASESGHTPSQESDSALDAEDEEENDDNSSASPEGNAERYKSMMDLTMS